MSKIDTIHQNKAEVQQVVSPHFEELWVMQDSSILRYLCSSCCQKFPETGDKNLLIPTFPANLAQGACVQEKSYEENTI